MDLAKEKETYNGGKMVKVICGMIGSGKTTYALSNKKENDILLDWDILADALNTDNKVYIKDVQDMLLEYFYKKGFNIWYITTKLGSNEKEILNRMEDVEFIWINTNKKQCENNIIKRNRNDEARCIEELKKCNYTIYQNYYTNKDIDYKIIDVFDSGERW